MIYQYVVARDDETKKVELVGRFRNGIAEIFFDGKWQFDSAIYSLQQDGLLENITEAVAQEMVTVLNSLQLQSA